MYGERVNFFVLLTDRCNLNCSYCRGRTFDGDAGDAFESGEIDETLPCDLDYDLHLLYRFLERDPGAVVTLYGGEPLLRADLVERITKEAPAKRFLLHTNGLLLDHLPFDVLERIDTLSVSLDGDEEQTDEHRGEGTFRKVIENLQRLKREGYRGEVIARMTVPVGADIERGVRYLSENSAYAFDSIHWQLDAGFASGMDIDRFRDWIHRSYNPGVSRLVRRWVEKISGECRVPRWYPFVATMRDTLEGRPSRLRCGCGHESYSIMTGGAITPCPIMVGLKRMYLGHISDTSPLSLPRMDVVGICRACQIREFCGGRCLFAHTMHLWSEEERRLVCGTVGHLRRCILQELPHIRGLIDEGKIRLDDLDFQRYNGCEIIP